MWSKFLERIFSHFYLEAWSFDPSKSLSWVIILLNAIKRRGKKTLLKKTKWNKHTQLNDITKQSEER